MFEQEEIRCGACNRLLLKMDHQALQGKISICCPRCKSMNTLRPCEPLTLSAQSAGSRKGKGHEPENC